MDLNTEHLRFNNGGLAGLYRLDTSKVTGIDLWAKLDMVINEYVKIHPNEMKMLVYENKAIGNSRMNSLASNKNKTVRWGASLPPALMFKLEEVEPMLFSSKKLFNSFLKRYKGLRICQSV